jgi:hypothetical protein
LQGNPLCGLPRVSADLGPSRCHFADTLCEELVEEVSLRKALTDRRQGHDEGSVAGQHGRLIMFKAYARDALGSLITTYDAAAT